MLFDLFNDWDISFVEHIMKLVILFDLFDNWEIF